MGRVLIACVVAVLSVFNGTWNATIASPPTERSRSATPGAPIVYGSVSCKERIDLPPMATVHVVLVDVSEKDARSATVGEQSIWPAGVKLPITFQIAYDPSRIDARHFYVVQARITDGEKVLYLNNTTYYVLTRGAPSKVDIIVAPVRGR